MRSSGFSHDVHAFFAGHLDALEADDSPAFVWYVCLIETLLAILEVIDGDLRLEGGRSDSSCKLSIVCC